MDTALANRVYELVTKYAGRPVEKLKPQLRLERDLGITGDDAFQLICEFQTTFEVDMTNFSFEEYFRPELIPFRQWFKKRSVRRLTIEMLVEAAVSKRWADREIPSS